jgi:hypothetical protein
MANTIPANNNTGLYNTVTGNATPINANVYATNVFASGFVSAAGNIYTSGFYFGDGSQLTNLPPSPSSYGNSNVTTLLAGFGSNTVSTTGNVSAGYFVGNGSLLTGVVTSSYGNSNVAAFLPTYTGALAGANLSVTGNITGGNLNVSGNISDTTGALQINSVGNINLAPTSTVTVAGAVSTTGNITGAYILGNGSQLTGLPATYGNSNVSTYLASGTNSNNIITGGNVQGGNLITSGAAGNIVGANYVSASYFVGDGSLLTNVVATSSYSNSNVTTLLASFGSNTVSTTGNISAGYFVGNGSQLTGITSTYGNANVNTLLNAWGSNALSTTGNVTASYVAGNGSLLSSLTGANVTGTVANATYATSAGTATTATTAGTVTANAQGNITSVGTLSSLSVTGNIVTGGILTDGYYYANGAPFSGGGGTYGNANVNTLLADWGSNNLSTTGNVSTSRLALPTDGRLIGDWGNSTTANRTAVQAVGNTFTTLNIIPGPGYTPPSNTTPPSSVQLYNNQDMGNAQAMRMSITPGSGLLRTTRTGTGTTPPMEFLIDSTSAIYIANGVSNTSFVGIGNTAPNDRLAVNGNASVSGTVTGGNVLTGGIVSATGNIRGGNILTAGDISATGGIFNTGNIAGGNISTTGQFSAQGNVVGGNLNTVGQVVATGNITGGNLLSSGQLSIGGAVTAVSVGASGLVQGGTINSPGAITGASFSTAGNVTGNYFIGNGSALTGISASPGGSPYQFQYNNSGAFGGVPNTNYYSGNGTIEMALTKFEATGTSGIITVPGTAGYVSVVGNVISGNVVTTGTVSATGNITGSYIFGNGSALTGITSTATAGGSNTQIQYNNANAFAGNSAMTFNNTTGTITLGNITTNTNQIQTVAAIDPANATAFGTTTPWRVLVGNAYLGSANSIYSSTSPGTLPNPLSAPRLLVADFVTLPNTGMRFQEHTNYVWANLSANVSNTSTRFSVQRNEMTFGGGTSNYQVTATNSPTLFLGSGTQINLGAGTNANLSLIGNIVTTAGTTGTFSGISVSNYSTANVIIAYSGQLSTNNANTTAFGNATTQIGYTFNFAGAPANANITGTTTAVAYYMPGATANTQLGGFNTTNGNIARMATNYYSFRSDDTLAKAQLGSLSSFNEFTGNITSSGGALTVDKSTAQVQQIYPTENITSITFSNFVARVQKPDSTYANQSDTVTLIIVQGATPYTVAMPSGTAYRYAGGINTVGSTANTTTMISITGTYNYNTAANQYLITISPEFS